MMKLVGQFAILSPHRPGTGFSLNTAFPVSINPPSAPYHPLTHSTPRLYKPWDESIVTNAQHAAHTINKFRLTNPVTTFFYFCFLSKNETNSMKLVKMLL